MDLGYDVINLSSNLIKLKILWVYLWMETSHGILSLLSNRVNKRRCLISSSWKTYTSLTKMSPQSKLRIIYLRNYVLLHISELILFSYYLMICQLGCILWTMVSLKSHRSTHVAIMLSLRALIQKRMGSLDP